MYRFPWYLTLVSTNHASSNPGLKRMLALWDRGKDYRAVFDSRSSLFAPAETTRKRLLGRLSGEHSLRVHL